MKKRLNKQKEVSETGEILRFINYIFIIIAAIFMFLLKIDTIAFLFIIICLINLFFINLYTKKIKLKRNNKITLNQLKENGVQVIPTVEQNGIDLCLKSHEDDVKAMVLAGIPYMIVQK